MWMAGRSPWAFASDPISVVRRGRGSRPRQPAVAPIPSKDAFRPMNILLLGSGGREHALAWKMAASPLDRPAHLRAGQCRHRARGRMRRARYRRPCGGDRVLPRQHASISSWSGRRRRSAPASSTTWKPPASRRSGRAAPRRGSKAPRASPRICAGRTAFRPPPMSASAPPIRPRPMCARTARRSWSRPTALPPARAWSWRRTVAEAEAAIDMMFGGGASGEAGGEVVIEEFLDGEEASFFALCDGDDRDRADHGAGPQARLRRRQGTEHRRHGRLFAGAEYR